MTSASNTTSRKTGNHLLALYAALNHAVLRAWCAAPSRWGRGTIRSKAKAPVRRNTFSEAVAAPTEKRGFVMPRFWGQCVCTVLWFRGVVGVIRKDARTASDVFLTTTLHPTRVETQTVALVTPEGAKTMTTSPVASRSAAPTIPAFDPVATHFEAVNAAAMARWYAARYNHPAAARKAGQALAALRKLVQFERGQATTSTSPCTNCPDNFPLPSGPLDFFDAHVVQDYIQRRTACDLCPAGAKPCLPEGGAA